MTTSRAWLAGLVGLLCLAALACRTAPADRDEPPFPLALEFEGQQAIPEAELRTVVLRELTRLEVAALDKAAVDDAAFALEQAYRARGHVDALVDYELGQRAGLPRARFRIHEGPAVHVRELVLEGPAALQPERVRTFFEPAASGGAFDEGELSLRIATLRAFYRERGFLAFTCAEPEVRFDEERTSVAVRIVLREGPVFRLRSVDVLGGVPELAELEAQLARQHTGRLALPLVVPEIQHALVEAYRLRGYPDVRVDVRLDADETSGDTRAHVTVVPAVRARIAHFQLEGNRRTRDAAVLGFLGLERGELYSSARLRDAFRALYATGLFDSVELELAGTGEERTLIVRVVEARSVEIRVEPGYGSYEGPRLLLGIEEKNFQGRGQVMQLEGAASLRAQGVRLSWIDRDFLGSRFTSETTAFAEQREEPSFEFVRRGVGFFLRRQWSEEWSSSTGYEFRPTDVSEDTTTPLAPDLEEDSDVAALSTAVTFDDRDNLLVPTRGRLARARLEWADDGLGSDVEFVRVQLELAHLARLGSQSVLATALRTGLIAPFGATDEIPLPERFFNGGESSVRSFREDELLPEGESGDPLGGEAATTLNLEYRRILTGSLTGALFFDAGNVTEEVQDYLDFDGFRAAYGAGLRYLLPIGPLRVDLGVNPNPRDDEDELVLHFSVGFPF